MLRNLTRAAAGLAAVLAVLPAAGVAAGAEPPAGRPIDAPAGHRRGPAHLEGSLLDDLDEGRAVNAVATASDTPGAPAERSVTVVVEASSTAQATTAVQHVGGTVSVELEGVVQADVPAARLGDLAGARGVTLVREPRMAQPAATSEGVGTTGANLWHAQSWTGTGTSVAIVDVGFNGYAALQGSELPTVTTDLGRCSSPFGTNHGTGVAEIVHDMAPGAAIRLVCVETEADFVSALSTFNGLGIDVVNASIAFTLGGRGDGSGGPNTIAGAVRALRDQNILFVAAGGNYGQAHWNGPAAGDFDGPAFNDLVDVEADDGLDFLVAPLATVTVGIQWDAWPQTSLDFDLFVYDPAQVGSCNNLTGVVNDFTFVGPDPVWTEGVNPQSDFPGPPIEWVEFTNCHNAYQTFEVLVNRYRGGGAPRLDMWLDGNAAFFTPTGSSIPEPASSPAVLAAGAHCFSETTVRPYSSIGPTIDGRVKPDLVAPDGVSTSPTSFGASGGCSSSSQGFTGTSASSPHVAGAAALLLGANPNLDVAELQQLLLDRAIDAGPAGDDNQFGAGRLAMGPAGQAATPPPQPLTSVAPVRMYDTRSIDTGVAESPPRSTPVGPGQFLEVPMRGFGGVPNDATAVVLNVTVDVPTAGGFVTVQPGTNQPTTSNLNFVAGQTVAQQVTATVAPDGKIRLYNGSAGNTHLIVDLSGWYGPNSSPGVPATARFSALTAPVRAFDSRVGTPGYAEVPARTTPFGNGQFVDVDLDLPGGVPEGATAAIVNLTVTEPTGNGWITVFPTGSPEPATSSINFINQQTVANLVVAPLDANGRIRLKASSNGTVHVIVDAIGWFQPDVGAGYIALDPPTRQLDTRTGTGPRLGPLGQTEVYDQTVGHYQGVPADAEAVVLGVVAVTPTGIGWLTVYPSGQAQPNVSNLNFTFGSIVPNAVVARLGANGRVAFANSNGVTHVISDVSGYFLDPADVPVPLANPPPPPPGFEAWQPPQAVLDGPATVVYLESSPTDWIGQGLTYTFTKANSGVSLYTQGGYLQTNVVLGAGDSWYGRFTLPNGITSWTAGDYTDVHQLPWFVPGMDWSGYGRGCDNLNGRYIVDHVLYQAGVINEITLRFEQRCEGIFTGPLRGFVRYDADDPTTPPPPGDPAGFAWHPPAGSVPPTGTYLYIQSTPGDYIANGRTELYTPANRTFTGSSTLSTPAWFQLDVSGTGTWWNFGFAVPYNLAQLQVGYYTNLPRFPFYSPAFGAVAFTGEGRGCNRSLGEVAVDSIVYNGPNIASIELRFVQRCEETGPPLYGALRWEAPPA